MADFSNFCDGEEMSTVNLIQHKVSWVWGLNRYPPSRDHSFLKALYANHLSEPPFAFYLKYYVNQASQISAAPDGVLTLGGTNSNLYKGSIDYLDLTGPPSHWLLAVSSVTVQGKTITFDLPSGLAAIDTGTTLIGAPTPLPQVFGPKCLTPQSLPATGKASYDTNVTVHISFGDTKWAISPLDMNLGTLTGTMIGNAHITSQMCASGIFDIGIGSTLSSLFVGFAQLTSGLTDLLTRTRCSLR
ncbi:aspartic peptidase domain-containing protein [Suillus lakei]|nr:aspartic peptidase domain-containing protein [Suillus lakei]